MIEFLIVVVERRSFCDRSSQSSCSSFMPANATTRVIISTAASTVARFDAATTHAAPMFVAKLTKMKT
jgi:hypothetical protein